MQLPGLIQFRKCTLTDKPLAEAVAAGLVEMYKEPVSVPIRHIPARPDEDFDLLVGEIVVRFLEKLELPQEIETLKSENAKLRELIDIVRKYAIIEYADSASCRMIASEIQKAFPCSFTK